MANEEGQVETGQTDDQETAIDPLGAMDSTNVATNPLASYEDEIEAIKRGEVTSEETDDEQEESADTDDSEDTDESEDTADDSEEEIEENQEEEVETEPEAKGRRIRISDSEDLAVIAISKAKGISIREATKLYEGINGTAATTETTAPTPVETVAQVEAEIQELFDKKLEAIRAIDVDAQADIEVQLMELNKKLAKVSVEEARANEAADEAYSRKYDENAALAMNHYPDLRNPESALFKEVARMDAEAREMGDPLFEAAEKPWIFAKKAAVKIGIPMTKPNANSQPIKKGNQGSPIKPASSNARATSADPQGFAKEIDGLDTLDAYERQVAALTGR